MLMTGLAVHAKLASAEGLSDMGTVRCKSSNRVRLIFSSQ